MAKRTGTSNGPTLCLRYDEQERAMLDLICKIDERSRAEEFRYLIKQRYEQIMKTYGKGNEIIAKNFDAIADDLRILISENKDEFSKLENREQQMLKMRADGKPYSEIGKEFKLSRQRVQKIIDAAIQKLKN